MLHRQSGGVYLLVIASIVTLNLRNRLSPVLLDNALMTGLSIDLGAGLQSFLRSKVNFNATSFRSEILTFKMRYLKWNKMK